MGVPPVISVVICGGNIKGGLMKLDTAATDFSRSGPGGKSGGSVENNQ